MGIERVELEGIEDRDDRWDRSDGGGCISSISEIRERGHEKAVSVGFPERPVADSCDLSPRSVAKVGGDGFGRWALGE